MNSLEKEDGETSGAICDRPSHNNRLGSKPNSWLSLKTILLALGILEALVSARGQGTFFTTIPAYLNGSCQIPPNDSTNVGVASFQYNPLGGTSVVCSVNFELPFAPMAAAIYGPAGPSATAPLLFNLGTFSVVTNVLAVITWPPATNYFTNISVRCTNNLTLTPEQMSQLQAGLFYVNVTSTNFPAGEVRGQITDRPVLTLASHEEGSWFAFKITGPPSNSYAIQVSSNLADWFTLTNFTPTNSVYTVVDADASNYPLRFYRVMR